MAEQEVTRVVQITKKMLSLYRESKKVVPIKLPEIVDSVAVLLQRPLRDKDVNLSKQFRTEAQISAFPAEMRQVASNLIANAIDAVEPGGHISVVVEDVLIKNSRPEVALVVADNGIGISKQDLPRPFPSVFHHQGRAWNWLGTLDHAGHRFQA